MNTKLIMIAAAVAIIIGGVAFYGGMKYAGSGNIRGQFSRADLQNLSPEERQQRMQEFGMNAGTGFRGGSGGSGQRASSGFTTGEIISKDDKSVTIKMRDGGSKIIFYSDTTEVGKFTTGTASDLEIGKNISVNGTANSNGSITAQMIQLRTLVK